MHDLVHELARSVMADEFLDASCDKGEASRCRYALLTDCSKPLKSATSPAKFRALRFQGCSEIEIHDAALLSAKSYVRVLDFNECMIQKLPCSIGQLKQLRYLNAPGVQDDIVPETITKLSKLCYLNLSGSSNISALPKSIGDMEALKHLNLSGCLGIVKMPESFQKLEKLVHLDLSCCTDVKGVSKSLSSITNLEHLNLSCCHQVEITPKVLGGLTKLQHLDLSYCKDIKHLSKILSSLTEPQYLNLSYCRRVKITLDVLCGLTKLQHLDLSYYEDVEGVFESLSSLTDLKYLNLSYCQQFKITPRVVGGLTKLQYLNLSHCSSHRLQPELLSNLTKIQYLNLCNFFCSLQTVEIQSFIDAISKLFNLEHLDLSENAGLKSIPNSFRNLRKLHTLDLSSCSELMSLPKSAVKSVKFLITKDSKLVRHIVVRDDARDYLLDNEEMIMHLHTDVHGLGVHDFESSLVTLKEENLISVLKITRLENVKSVEEARSIELSGKVILIDLNLAWTRGAKRFVEDMELLGELQPPSTLNRLELHGYNSVSFPGWLMGIKSTSLPNLVKINMVDLPNCNNLPPFGELPKLEELRLCRMNSITKIDKSFYGHSRAFPRLKEFRLICMENLEEWNKTYSCSEDVSNESMFPNLEILEIDYCAKLRFNCPTASFNWRILNNDDVTSSWDKDHLIEWRTLHHLPALSWLTIGGPIDLISSSDWFGHLALLQSLSLDFRGNMTSLREPTSLSARRLSLLTLFRRPNNSNLQELEQWCESHDNKSQLSSLNSPSMSNCRCMTLLPQWLGELTSLKELEIRQSYGIKSLPDSIQQLSNLQELVISSCHGLEQLCESRDNKFQLYSLKSLRLSCCRSITSLPQWLGELTSLNILEIYQCDGIKSLPDSIQQLSSLREINFFSCHELEKWCKSDDNKRILAHIQTKVFG